ncbi:MAG: hypothetical protein HY909_11240 [Deltaproteobacteria bacterium]|nr:hypothetical protein [Deltaproteobacteria bacterium]
MRSSFLRLVASVVVIAVEGCGDCGGGGGFGFGARAADAVALQPSASVLREADGATVVEVQLQVPGDRCSAGPTVTRFFRWNPMTLRAEPTQQGHQAGSRILPPTTQGGGTDTYEDVAPGLTVRIAPNFSGQAVTVTFTTATSTQTLSCAAQGGSLVCT